MNLKPDIIKVAALLLNEKGELLIVRPKDKNYWISLGGKVEEEESYEDCLKREVREEIMCEVKSFKFFVSSELEEAIGKKDTYIQIYFYLIEIEGIPQINDSDNIEEIKWISKDWLRNNQKTQKVEIGSSLLNFAIPKLIENKLLK